MMVVICYASPIDSENSQQTTTSAAAAVAKIFINSSMTRSSARSFVSISSTIECKWSLTSAEDEDHDEDDERIFRSTSSSWQSTPCCKHYSRSIKVIKNEIEDHITGWQ